MNSKVFGFLVVLSLISIIPVADAQISIGQSAVQKSVEVIRVIRTELELRGDGTEKEPYRRIEQFWSLAGDLLWENDPYKKSKQKKR